MLSKNQIYGYFEEINDKLKERGQHGEILLAGGAALTLVFNARNSTRDIDAIFKPTADMRDIISRAVKPLALAMGI